MRILGIETATVRGSVALVEEATLVAALEHDEPHAHGERMLSLVERALAQAGWSRTDLDRIAVGIGPGSFTGVRIGMALGVGLALGLDRPAVGVGSLRAMAAAVPADVPGARWVVLDARRGELFVAAFDRAGVELVAPHLRRLDVLFEGIDGDFVLAGELPVSAAGRRVHRHPYADLPHAAMTARLARDLPPAIPEPEYVRPADAILPTLPPSPLGRR